MVSLDESLALNQIQAHLGDNVEIRCDISGEPQRPAIKWYRHGVDLSSINLSYIKVTFYILKLNIWSLFLKNNIFLLFLGFQ